MRMGRRFRFGATLCSATILGTIAVPAMFLEAHAADTDATTSTKTKKIVKKTATAPSAATAPAAASAKHSGNAAVLRTARQGDTEPKGGSESIIVTGSLIHDPNLHSASPMTQLTRQGLQQRGIKTVTDALQQLSSNGAGNLTSAFSANGAFAAGASAPSLRGLSTDSTLVLMDGQRLSYYPLSDDGERNFVDTQWMPSSIMERTDVLQDGGSATYGADAVAGVVNMVTRRQIKGVEANAEGGLSQRGDTGHQRLYATFGHGDLDRDGYNVYINSEYQQDDALYNRQLGYPYNSGDLTGIGGGNGNYNVASNGAINNFVATPNAVVRPVDSSGAAAGPWQLLNPSAGCSATGGGGLVTGTVNGGVGNNNQACTMNSERYGMVVPSVRRISASAHFIANVTPRSQFTTMFNYAQTDTYELSHNPYPVQTSNQNKSVSLIGIQIPALLPNGQLNPNDPFAAQGQNANIYGTFGNNVPGNTQFSQTFRGSARYSGWEPSKWGSDWKYDVNFVGMNTLLDQTYTGYPNVYALQNAVNDGTYNFVNPSQTPASVVNSIFPNVTTHSRSQEYSGEMTASKGLFRLPGGMTTLAIGGNVRWEALNDPNANPTINNVASTQLYAGINPFNAQGSRWVESGFFEVALPFHKMFDADISGRYDNYSTGNRHFSPKVGVNFRPTDSLTMRGTFSRGFRIPSFAETGGSNVGYTNYTIKNADWIAEHNGDAYTNAYSLGVNSSGNKNLKPEISTNVTGGMVFHPTNWVSLSVDYYYIEKQRYITANPIQAGDVAEAYIANGGSYSAPGVTVTPDTVDPQDPSASVRPGIINIGYINANKLVTDGVDAEFSARHRLPGALHDVMWSSHGQFTYVRNFNLTLPNGSVQHYAGTIGPWEAVSASGTPRWRANWANTFTWKSLSVTPTVYYTSGYKTVSEDYQAGLGCGQSLAQVNNSFAPAQCHVKNWWDVDLTLSYQVNKRLNVYANVYNLLGFRAPYDFATYGSYLYNSSWAQKGIIMRSFQFGATLTL
ncbi:TonB-dependent receptor [Gluconobacter roseus NBRC 3990]|uniref:TonB-dependent receptor n=2 Tax=Gluconobacter roseus TaxID=586239 RepID=A0A4Y3M1V8_9PROT|nr:TonB-dependent receptor [Gluconobacter roseus NBRC 3990]GLP93055.1 TonB-dependent receptor [Gluconobacter roseus NBRC 3990]